MKILRSFAVAFAAFFIACNPVSAQWQTPDHSVPIGRGSGTGFKFAAPGVAGQSLVSNGASSDPTFQAIAGPAFGTQTANTVFSGPTSGGAANPTFRALVGADLPNPSASTLGGVQSLTCSANQWLNTISVSGVPACAQPAFSNISGTAAATQGGTGLSTFAIGDLLQANATNTLARLAAVATGNVLISGGVGAVSSWGKVGLTTHVSGTLPVANGGTNCAVASGTCVDNISGFASTGFLTRTGAGTYAFQSATNGITRANLAQVPANSYSGNPTTSTANETGFTASSLTLKASPVSGDVVIIEDSAASFGLKKTTVGALASAGSVGSFNGRTGAVVPVQGDYPASLIPGTATNNNATAGNIGEYAESTSAITTNSMTLNTPINCASVSLTAGDWDVGGTVTANGTASTVLLYLESAINTSSATRNFARSNTIYGGNSTYYGTINANGLSLSAPSFRASLASTTTVYLIGYSAFTTSTQTCGGTIWARRAR